MSAPAPRARRAPLRPGDLLRAGPRRLRRRAGAALAALGLAAATASLLGPVAPVGARSGGEGVTYLCGPSPAFDCTADSGYRGQSLWGSYGPGHNCVSYAAYRLQQNGAERPWAWTNLGDGGAWDDKARDAGVRVDTVPAVGAIAQWDGGSGHVAYVESVAPDHIVVSEDAFEGFTAVRRIERSSPTFAEAEFIHVADLDGAVDDLVLHRPGGAADRAWFGGRGSRTPMPGAIDLDDEVAPLAGDFDADGVDDLLFDAAGTAEDRIVWGRTGSGGGVPAALAPRQPDEVQGVVGDLDGDGADDVLWLGAGTRPDAVWWGRAGERRFEVEERTIAGRWRADAGDLDGDGADDVVLVGAEEHRVLWGTPGRRRLSAEPLAIEGSGRPVLGDLDGDGRDDIVLVDPDGDAIWWSAEGRAAGRATPVTIPARARLATGDLDGDGVDEIVLHRPESRHDQIWWGSRARGLPVVTPVALPGTGWPVVADLDGR